MDKVIEEVSRNLTLRYEEQIRYLTTEKEKAGVKKVISKTGLSDSKENGGAEDLAECAVGRMLDGMRSGKISSDNKPSLTEQLIQEVFKSKLKQGTLKYLMELKIETRNKEVHKAWKGQRVLQKSGIKTAKNHYYVNSSPKKLCGNAESYGYRLGMKQEAEKLNLSK